MADINIAFDRRQVAGWEQMLGGRLKKERELEGMKNGKLLYFKHVIPGLSDLLI